MIKICIGFLIGLSGLFWLENNQQSVILLIASFVCLCCLYIFKRHLIRDLAAPLIGCLWASMAASLWLYTTPQLLSIPKVAHVQGYICSLPVHHQSINSFSKDQSISLRLSFDFCLTDIDQHNLSFYQANKLRLNHYQTTEELAKQFLAGSYWKLNVKLKPIHGRLNPGGFDYEKWLVSEGFIGTGYIKTFEPIAAGLSIKSYYQTIRQRIFLALNAV